MMIMKKQVNEMRNMIRRKEKGKVFRQVRRGEQIE